MAGGILAVAFLVALVRGNSAPPPPAAKPPQAGESSPSGSGAGSGDLARTITPTGPRGAVALDGLTFAWMPVSGATTYRVTVYDALMKKVWTSDDVSTTSVEAPEKVRGYLQPGHLYHWTVATSGVEGPRLESEATSFRLVAPSPSPAPS